MNKERSVYSKVNREQCYVPRSEHGTVLHSTSEHGTVLHSKSEHGTVLKLRKREQGTMLHSKTEQGTVLTFQKRTGNSIIFQKFKRTRNSVIPKVYREQCYIPEVNKECVTFC